MLSNSMLARGQYAADCIGASNAEDAQKIADFVTNNPSLVSLYGDRCNIEAARRLRIPLIQKWFEPFKLNTVMTEGKNLALDTILAGSSYTVVGPYMGLISSVSYSAIAAGDTAAQINGTNGWKEAGSGTNYPLYTTPRKTPSWSAAAAGSKAMSAALAFPIVTTGGTVKGAFMIFGTGAVTTIADVNGKLISAGLFGTGDRIVLAGDTINVSWSLAL